ncbi:MAG: amino acid ABC transporter substrate-binding protein [Thermoprotei archaeon]|nr:MAG: amino acid ABC transporter substrate-binding protein [Thermoprotei archaeon]
MRYSVHVAVGLIIGLVLGLLIGTALLKPATVPVETAKSRLELIKQRGKLIVGTSADWPPFEYVEAGKYCGIDIRIAEEIAKELGVELEVKDMKFAALVEALRKGMVDMVIADMSITAEREKVVDFSIPYYMGCSVVVVLKGSGIRSVEDLYGKVIGVQLGTVQEEWAKEVLEKAGKATVKSYDRVYPEMVMALKRGDVDAIVIGNIFAEVLCRKFPELEIAFVVPGSEKFTAIALPPGDEEFKYFINKVLEKLRTTGKLNEIFDEEISKWLTGE